MTHSVLLDLVLRLGPTQKLCLGPTVAQKHDITCVMKWQQTSVGKSGGEYWN